MLPELLADVNKMQDVQFGWENMEALDQTRSLSTVVSSYDTVRTCVTAIL